MILFTLILGFLSNPDADALEASAGQIEWVGLSSETEAQLDLFVLKPPAVESYFAAKGWEMNSPLTSDQISKLTGTQRTIVGRFKSKHEEFAVIGEWIQETIYLRPHIPEWIERLKSHRSMDSQDVFGAAKIVVLKQKTDTLKQLSLRGFSTNTATSFEDLQPTHSKIPAYKVSRWYRLSEGEDDDFIWTEIKLGDSSLPLGFFESASPSRKYLNKHSISEIDSFFRLSKDDEKLKETGERLFGSSERAAEGQCASLSATYALASIDEADKIMTYAYSNTRSDLTQKRSDHHLLTFERSPNTAGDLEVKMWSQTGDKRHSEIFTLKKF